MRLRGIAEFLNLEHEGEDIGITALNSLLRANFTRLAYRDGERGTKDIPNTGATAILAAKEYENLVSKDTKALTTQSPHLCFVFLSKIFAKPLFSNAREKVQNIAKSAKIMPNVYIGNDVNMGENVVIMTGTYIGDDVGIGGESIIHLNVVTYNDNKIGKKCRLFANCVIGNDGFGYTHSRDGEYYKIYHSGNTVLGDFVEMGACTTIGRTVFDSIVIKAGTKVNSLVQISHNYDIKQSCIIIAQIGISGSSELGRDVVIGGQSATSGHLRIGDFSIVAARGGVSRNLEGSGVYGDFPIMPQKDWPKLQAKIATKFRE